MFFLQKLFKLGTTAAAKKFGDTEKPFLDHLEDLRGTLMKVIGTLVISTIIAFIFYKDLINIINYPVEQAGYDARLLVLSPFEGFMSVLKICLYSGLILSFPILLYFIGEFVIPGLNKKEKKLIIPVIIASFLLFASGVLFSYFVVIPRALAFFQEPGRELADEIRDVPIIAPAGHLAVLQGVERREGVRDLLAGLEGPDLGVVEEDDVAVSGDAVVGGTARPQGGAKACRLDRPGVVMTQHMGRVARGEAGGDHQAALDQAFERALRVVAGK